MTFNSKINRGYRCRRIVFVTSSQVEQTLLGERIIRNRRQITSRLGALLPKFIFRHGHTPEPPTRMVLESTECAQWYGAGVDKSCLFRSEFIECSLGGPRTVRGGWICLLVFLRACRGLSAFWMADAEPVCLPCSRWRARDHGSLGGARRLYEIWRAGRRNPWTMRADQTTRLWPQAIIGYAPRLYRGRRCF